MKRQQQEEEEKRQKKEAVQLGTGGGGRWKKEEEDWLLPFARWRLTFFKCKGGSYSDSIQALSTVLYSGERACPLLSHWLLVCYNT